MNISIIRPSRIIPDGSFQGQQGVLPLGLAYITAAIKKSGCQVQLIDALGEDLDRFTHVPNDKYTYQGISNEEIVTRIKKDSEYIAISVMFSSELIHVRKLCDLLFNVLPNVPLILGGEACSADTEFFLKSLKQRTYICSGEGDETIVELLECLRTNNSLENINGITFLKNNKIISTGKRNRKKNLDEIAWPAWEEFPVENYLERNLATTMRGKRVIPMLASRGCPYRCSFCSSPNMWTTLWNSRSPLDVVKEMEFYRDKYKVEHIEFFDLTMIINRNWIVEFCNLLIERKFDITWGLPSGTRSEVLTNETIPLLYKSGCKRISIAPESGSKKTLKLIQKRVNLEKMLKTIKLCNKHQIHLKAHMIYGFPSETRLDVIKSLYFVMKMAFAGLDDCLAYRFTPYPGSQLYNELKENFPKDLKEREAHYVGSIPNSLFSKDNWSEHYTQIELTLILVVSMGLFYSISYIRYPGRFLNTIKRIIKRQPTTMIDLLISDILKIRPDYK